MWRSVTPILILGAVLWPVASAAAAPPIAWETWSDDLFTRASHENRYVLLDLEAVWCHWCHVMDERTYRDEGVRTLVEQFFIPVRVDEDSRPDLFERYKYWGWPATIILAPDGSERVKLRGYHGAELFALILQGALGAPPEEAAAAAAQRRALSRIPEDQRLSFERDLRESFDQVNAGWGRGYKLIDGFAIGYALDRAFAGDDKEAETQARATLDHALDLIDPVWGGAYQYSDAADWKSPHFEKIMPSQAVSLRSYATAFARWKEPRYRRAADDMYRYLRAFLLAPDGAFYTSQDADLNGEVDGHHYYALGDAERRRLGVPAIDTHRYARENGMAIAALAAYHDATGSREALDIALGAADWILANRALPNGGFRHDAIDRYGPFLGDSLAMGEAFLALYRSTAERRWLTQARLAADFIAAHFIDAGSGAFTAVQPQERAQFAQPPIPIDGNIAAARLFNLLSYVAGEPRYRAVAEAALGYLTSPAVTPGIDVLPGTLLLDRELSREPVHVTIVGPKQEALARRLFAAALAYPAAYKRVDWWDRREGPLANNDVEFPDKPDVAAYACIQNICSVPVTAPEEVAAALNALGRSAP